MFGIFKRDSSQGSYSGEVRNGQHMDLVSTSLRMEVAMKVDFFLMNSMEKENSLFLMEGSLKGNGQTDISMKESENL